MKNFTSIHDIQDVHALVDLAKACKADPIGNTMLGKNKTLGLVFFNPSLRTRWSTQKAAQNLGMHVISMNATQGWAIEFEDGAIMNLDKAEHIKEAAQVLSQYCDIIAIRTFPSLEDKEKDYADFILNQFIKFADVPILSMESAIRHPLQSLTDLLTIEEHKTVEKPRIVLTWAPHPKRLPQAVANSFAEWVTAVEYDLIITHPEGYELSEEFTRGATISYDQVSAFEGADFIYAKNWSSFHNYGNTNSPEKNWIINKAKMDLTNEAKFMHCLPVRRNVVVADEVIDSRNSIVIQQAGNRTWAAQAVLQHMVSE